MLFFTLLAIIVRSTYYPFSDYSDEELKLLKATKQGNASLVEQLLEINTFVDVRDNLYELSLEKKEFWYGTPLILAGKNHGCSKYRNLVNSFAPK